MKSHEAVICCRFCRYLLQQVGEWQVSFHLVAWTAWCCHRRVHDAAVLWRTEPSLSTDSSAIHPSRLAEAASCHVGSAAFHPGRCHAGDWHA